MIYYIGLKYFKNIRKTSGLVVFIDAMSSTFKRCGSETEEKLVPFGLIYSTSFGLFLNFSTYVYHYCKSK